MNLRDLHVLHWHVPHVPTGMPGDGVDPILGDAFLIDTCQRRVAVLLGLEACERAGRAFPADGALERFAGNDAYAFLLRFACGLESKLVAETEIFGQIKQAWREFEDRDSTLARQLSPWMQLLFQDAKTIRAQHLSHLGSASYGSQVRRLLGEHADRGDTLLVGAGQLAQSVAPWLVGTRLWLANRTRERAVELVRELAKRSPQRPVSVIEAGLDAELAAWRTAQNVVVCVPADEAADAARVAAWRARSAAGGQVIHLGLGAVAGVPWGELPGLVSLGTLFEMLRMQSQLRARQLQRARDACREKAVLRSLGASSSHPHSWEDLAAFHTL